MTSSKIVTGLCVCEHLDFTHFDEVAHCALCWCSSFRQKKIV